MRFFFSASLCTEIVYSADQPCACSQWRGDTCVPRVGGRKIARHSRGCTQHQSYEACAGSDGNFRGFGWSEPNTCVWRGPISARQQANAKQSQDKGPVKKISNRQEQKRLNTSANSKEPQETQQGVGQLSNISTIVMERTTSTFAPTNAHETHSREPARARTAPMPSPPGDGTILSWHEHARQHQRSEPIRESSRAPLAISPQPSHPPTQRGPVTAPEANKRPSAPAHARVIRKDPRKTQQISDTSTTKMERQPSSHTFTNASASQENQEAFLPVKGPEGFVHETLGATDWAFDSTTLVLLDDVFVSRERGKWPAINWFSPSTTVRIGQLLALVVLLWITRTRLFRVVKRTRHGKKILYASIPTSVAVLWFWFGLDNGPTDIQVQHVDTSDGPADRMFTPPPPHDSIVTSTIAILKVHTLEPVTQSTPFPIGSDAAPIPAHADEIVSFQSVIQSAALPKPESSVVHSSSLPPATISILDFGAKPDGRNIHTAISQAMDLCSASGGCSLIFPFVNTDRERTVYVTSSFALVSNVRLILPSGVTLRATESDEDNIGDPSLWPTLPWLEWPSMPCNDCSYPCSAGCGPVKRGWIYGQNISNVEIAGGGLLHGGGWYWWCARDLQQTKRTSPPKFCDRRKRPRMLQSTCPPRMVHLVGARGVTLRDIQLSTSGFWMIHIQFCDGMLFDNVTLFNVNDGSMNAPNGDGIDVSNSRNIVIRNSLIDVSDNHIAVRAGQGHAAAVQVGKGTLPGSGRCGSHSVLVHNCEMRNGHGMGTGSDGAGGIRNITFRNIFVNGAGPQGVVPANKAKMSFHGTARAVFIWCRPDRGGIYQDISFVNFTGVNVVNGIEIRQGFHYHRSTPWPVPLPLPWGEGAMEKGPPTFRNILFSQFKLSAVHDEGRNFHIIRGSINNLTIKDIDLRPVRHEHLYRKAPLAWSCGVVGKQMPNTFYCRGCNSRNVQPPLSGKGYDCTFKE